MIKAYYLHTGADGDSHVTRGYVSEDEVSKVETIHFKESPVHAERSWHHAPTTNYVITLSGVLEFTTRGGENFILEPGDILIATDTTGTGHTFRLIDDQPWRRVYVTFAAGSDPHFVAE